MINHWKYFCGSKGNKDEGLSEDFFIAMGIFGQSLQEKNIDIVKQGIKNLNLLNDRYYLFSKPFFRRELYFPFIKILFGVVTSGSHSILQDEIWEIMVAMIKHDTLFFTDVRHREPPLTPSLFLR